MSSLKDKLKEIESKAQCFSEKSTELSDFVCWFEEALIGLKSKREVSVKVHSSEHLVFGRYKNSWAIFTRTHDSDFGPVELRVRDLSIVDKAKLAVLFPTLLELLDSQQSKDLDSVDLALETNADFIAQWKEGE